MKIPALEHITLTTGAARISPRREVEDHVVARIRACLAAGGELWAGWSVLRLPSPAGGVLWQALHGGVALAQVWQCHDAAASAAWWEAAEAAAPGDVVLHRPRGVPWLAAALFPEGVLAASHTPHVLLELGDLERCVGWALIPDGTQ